MKIMMNDGEIKCKTHPDAPHGFLRNESHTQDRYVCECEFWEPEEHTMTEDEEFEALEQRLNYKPEPPASKPWVGLTDEDKAEIEKIVGITEDDDGWMVSQMFTLTETKLKEKNA